MRSLPWLSALLTPGVLAVLAIPVPILTTAASADVRALHGHTIIAPRITIHSRHGAISRRILVIGLSGPRRSDVHADAHLAEALVDATAKLNTPKEARSEAVLMVLSCCSQ